MILKQRILVILIMGLLASPVALAKFDAPTAPSKTSAHSIDAIVAIVNDTIITQSQLNLVLARDKQRLAAMGQADVSNDQLRKQALQSMIDQQLMLQVAKQHNLKASEADIDAAVERLAKANHMSVEQFKVRLRTDGMQYKQFRKDISKQIVISRMQRQVVGDKIVITPHDVAQFKQKQHKSQSGRKQYRIADFVVKLPSSPTADQQKQAQQQANQLIAKLKQGADPSQVDQAYDDLGWRTLQQLPDLFVKPVESMPAHGVSAPISAGNGIHVLALIATRTPKSQLSDEQIKRLLWQQRANMQIQKWLKQLHQTAYIKIMSP